MQMKDWVVATRGWHPRNPADTRISVVAAAGLALILQEIAALNPLFCTLP